MKKIIIIAVFICIYQNTFTQNNNNNNSLKQELTDVATKSQYPHLQHLSTIVLLYTGYQTNLTIDPQLTESLKMSYCNNYQPEMGNRMVISSDRKFKTYIYSPKQGEQSLCISNLQTNTLVKIIPIFDQKLLYLQFYPNIFACCYKEPQLDVVYLHTLDLGTIPPTEKINPLKASTPVITYMPEKKLFVSAGLLDNNRSNVIISYSNVKPLATIHHSKIVDTIIFNEKIPLLACADNDCTVVIWKFESDASWKPLSTATLPHKAPVKSIFLNPQANYLLSGTHNDKEVQFYVWDLTTNTQIFTFPLQNHFFKSMPIYCSWDTLEKPLLDEEGIESKETQRITLESKAFYYTTTPEKLFEVIALQKKWQTSNNNNLLPSSTSYNTITRAIDDVTVSLAAQLKIENDSSTTLQSIDLSPDTSNQDISSGNENDNTDASQQTSGSSTHTAVSRMPSV